jgi:hypothetical protein
MADMKKNPEQNSGEYSIFHEEKPSELLENLIMHSGSCVIDCEHCGRTHYDGSGEYMDEGELEDLQQKHRANLEGYCSRDGQPRWGHLDGKQAVIGCPCNIIAVYEDLFWSHRDLICRYITDRAEQEHEDAGKTLEKAKEASKAIA